MKKILIIFVLILVAFIIFMPVQANTNNKKDTITFESHCLNLKELENLLLEFEEEPLLTMFSLREDKNGKSNPNNAVIFANPKTKSWTLVEKIDENKYCIIGIGGNIAPFIEDTDKKV
jgi:hypothetical protein